EGPSLKLFLNGNLAVYKQDASYTTGGIGIWTNKGAALGNFQANAIAETVPNNLPFADAFGSPSAANQLNNANWVEQNGNFNLSTGSAVGQNTAGYNVASVLNLSGTNVTVQASVTVAVGQMA